jgi:uncharacterized protein (DUF2235 family)
MKGVRVRFMGIFDTVASFGVPGNNVDVGYNFQVNSKSVERVAHAVADDEHRTLFPLQSIKSSKDAKLPPNMVEKKFQGAHADVGGGYGFEKRGARGQLIDKPNDASRFPLKWMYEQGQQVGVEMDGMPNDKQYQPSAGAVATNNPEHDALYRKVYTNDSRYWKFGDKGERTIYYQGDPE